MHLLPGKQQTTQTDKMKKMELRLPEQELSYKLSNKTFKATMTATTMNDAIIPPHCLEHAQLKRLLKVVEPEKHVSWYL